LLRTHGPRKLGVHGRSKYCESAGSEAAPHPGHMPFDLSIGQLSTPGNVLAQSARHDCNGFGNARALDC
jgi:hypothetical protein